MSMDQLVERMRRLPNIDEMGHAVTVEQLDDVERKLDLRLPQEFREFMMQVGHFSSEYFYFFGMHPEYEDESIVELTLYNRALLEKEKASKLRRRDELIEMLERWPQKAIVVNDGGDDSWYLLYSLDSDRPGEVMYLDGDMAWREDESWPSFTAYLEECIKFAEEQAGEAR